MPIRGSRGEQLDQPGVELIHQSSALRRILFSSFAELASIIEQIAQYFN